MRINKDLSDKDQAITYFVHLQKKTQISNFLLTSLSVDIPRTIGIVFNHKLVTILLVSVTSSHVDVGRQERQRDTISKTHYHNIQHYLRSTSQTSPASQLPVISQQSGEDPESIKRVSTQFSINMSLITHCAVFQHLRSLQRTKSSIKCCCCPSPVVEISVRSVPTRNTWLVTHFLRLNVCIELQQQLSRTYSHSGHWAGFIRFKS